MKKLDICDKCHKPIETLSIHVSIKGIKYTLCIRCMRLLKNSIDK